MERITGQLSDHFHSDEFKCHCGQCSTHSISWLLIQRLEIIREKTGGAIQITSGYRCKKHNKNVGGEESSKHLVGLAADIKSKICEPKDVADIINDMWPNTCGLGRYKTFTHFDVRYHRARWGKN